MFHRSRTDTVATYGAEFDRRGGDTEGLRYAEADATFGLVLGPAGPCDAGDRHRA